MLWFGLVLLLVGVLVVVLSVLPTNGPMRLLVLSIGLMIASMGFSAERTLAGLRGYANTEQYKVISYGLFDGTVVFETKNGRKIACSWDDITHEGVRVVC